jgi:hypothetical protein
MAAIRVQLMKNIVHLLSGTARPAAWRARRIDHSLSNAVSHVGSHSGRLSTAASAAVAAAAKMTLAN